MHHHHHLFIGALIPIAVVATLIVTKPSKHQSNGPVVFTVKKR